MAMSATGIWITIAVLTLVIVALRNAFLVAPRAWLPRGVVERALRYAPLAALVALVAPEVLSSLTGPAGPLATSGVPAPLDSPAVFQALGALAADPRLVSALVLVVVGRLGGNPFVALASAVGVFWWLG